MTYCTYNDSYACLNCMLKGKCVQRFIEPVTEAEIRNPYFVHDFLRFGHELGWGAAEWKPKLNDLNANPNIVFMNSDGEEVFLDLAWLEVDDDLLFEGSAKDVTRAHEKNREFFKYWFGEAKPCRKCIRFGDETVERFIIIASILKSAYPHEAQFWGLEGKAANDNTPS